MKNLNQQILSFYAHNNSIPFVRNFPNVKFLYVSFQILSIFLLREKFALMFAIALTSSSPMHYEVLGVSNIRYRQVAIFADESNILSLRL